MAFFWDQVVLDTTADAAVAPGEAAPIVPTPTTGAGKDATGQPIQEVVPAGDPAKAADVGAGVATNGAVAAASRPAVDPARAAEEAAAVDALRRLSGGGGDDTAPAAAPAPPGTVGHVPWRPNAPGRRRGPPQPQQQPRSPPRRGQRQQPGRRPPGHAPPPGATRSPDSSRRGTAAPPRRRGAGSPPRGGGGGGGVPGQAELATLLQKAETALARVRTAEAQLAERTGAALPAAPPDDSNTLTFV